MAGYAAAGEILANLASSFLGGKSNSAYKSYKYSRALQEHQYELNRQTRQTAFQDTRYSLQQAGYNPMLAVGQQAQGGTFGATMNVTDAKTENLQNKLASLQAITGSRLNSAQANLHNKNAFATVINALNNTNQTNAQVGLLNQQAQGQQIQNMIQNATGLNTAMATLQNIKSQTTNNQAQARLNSAQTKVANSTANLITNQATQVGLQNQAQSAQAQWYKNHPRLAQLAQFNSNLLGPMLGSVGSAVNSATTVMNPAKTVVSVKK